MPISQSGRRDPNVIESKVMVSSTGHDGPMGASGVKRLARLGMITGAPGMSALDMNTGEGVFRLRLLHKSIQ
jgi:ribulose 1,5-bisphosphate synthetase/thiazole synthase